MSEQNGTPKRILIEMSPDGSRVNIRHNISSRTEYYGLLEYAKERELAHGVQERLKASQQRRIATPEGKIPNLKVSD